MKVSDDEKIGMKNAYQGVYEEIQKIQTELRRKGKDGEALLFCGLEQYVIDRMNEIQYL